VDHKGLLPFDTQLISSPLALHHHSNARQVFYAGTTWTMREAA
jgi:hypothetical protein